jgi:hypothetical protein
LKNGSVLCHQAPNTHDMALLTPPNTLQTPMVHLVNSQRAGDGLFEFVFRERFVVFGALVQSECHRGGSEIVVRSDDLVATLFWRRLCRQRHGANAGIYKLIAHGVVSLRTNGGLGAAGGDRQKKDDDGHSVGLVVRRLVVRSDVGSVLNSGPPEALSVKRHQ